MRAPRPRRQGNRGHRRLRRAVSAPALIFFFPSSREHPPHALQYDISARSSPPPASHPTLDLPSAARLTFEVYAELRKAFRQLDGEPDVRSIVITGSGRAFCSGGDVEDIIGQLFKRDYRGLLAFTRATGDLILSMLHCRRPIVGALNGLVAGAGAVIATACDVRIAGPSAKIAFLFTKVGLSGADMGVSWLLPRMRLGGQ